MIIVSRLKTKSVRKKISLLLVAALTLGSFAVQTASAATLTNSSVLLSDPRPDATAASVKYTIKWTEATDTSIKCIKYTFTTTATGTTAPTGFTVASGANADTGSWTGITQASWTTDFTQAVNVIQLTNASGQNPSAAVTTIFSGITNPTSENPYYTKINTYSNTDCSTGAVDSVVVGWFTTNAVLVSATIDATLTFTVAGLAPGTTLKTGITVSTGCSDTATAVTFPLGPTDPMNPDTNYQCGQSLTVSTNADDGYTVTTRGTHASSDFLKHTGDSATTITDHTGSNASPTAFVGGTSEAFGYTTDDGSLGTGTAGRFGSADVWAAFVNASGTPEEVAYSGGPVSAEVTKIGLRLRFMGTTDAGTYTGTLVYTCTPIF